MNAILLSLCLYTLSAFELLEMNRDLEKDGLHRVLSTSVIVRIDSEEDLANCSLVLKEHVNKDTYIYVDELQRLPDFEFHPKTTIDIERPSTASEEHTLIWRLPLSLLVTGNEWVSNIQYLEVTKNSSGLTQFNLKADQQQGTEWPIYVRSQARFQYHLRYQPCVSKGNYTYINVAEGLDVYGDCENK